MTDYSVEYHTAKNELLESLHRMVDVSIERVAYILRSSGVDVTTVRIHLLDDDEHVTVTTPEDPTKVDEILAIADNSDDLWEGMEIIFGHEGIQDREQVQLPRISNIQYSENEVSLDFSII